MTPLEGRRAAADRSHVCVRLRSEQGFGLIELLMAMVMLNIGILAVVAAFNSGIFALNRASRVTTASALSDSQMEAYRALKYAAIALDTTTLSGVDRKPYRVDTYITSSTPTGGRALKIVTVVVRDGGKLSARPLARVASTFDESTGSSHETPYRVDTYLTSSTPTGGRALKIVTVVVRDGSKLSARPLARVASTFDESTGS